VNCTTFSRPGALGVVAVLRVPEGCDSQHEVF
jgi:hypothetical protein